MARPGATKQDNSDPAPRATQTRQLRPGPARDPNKTNQTPRITHQAGFIQHQDIAFRDEAFHRHLGGNTRDVRARVHEHRADEIGEDGL